MKILRLLGIVIVVGTMASAGALQQRSKTFYSSGVPRVTSQKTMTESDGSIIRTTTMVGSVKEIHWAPVALVGVIVFGGLGCIYYSRAQQMKARQNVKR